MSRRNTRLPVALAALAVAGAVRAQTPPPPVPPSAAAVAAEGLAVRIITEQGQRDIRLMRRREDDLFFRLPDAPVGVQASFKPESVQEAEFALAYDEFRVYTLIVRRQYIEAAQLLLPWVTPTLPYLDLPENNAIDPATTAARCLVRAAEQRVRLGAEESDPEVRKYYEAAVSIYEALSRADWHIYAETAGLRALMCMIRLGRLDEVERRLAQARPPEIGDASYGAYWLARARYLYARDDPRNALAAVVRAIDFENKDVDTFPDALILSGICYEDINEIHRARDVYYEIARLFRSTVWGDDAHGRLRFIMENGLTARAEEANVAGVFFGTEEDMNAKATDFLKATARPAPEAAASNVVPAAVTNAPAARPEEEKKP